jgi:outer membrane protein OmpA-like peptidoglycan-associated protein
LFIRKISQTERGNKSINNRRNNMSVLPHPRNPGNRNWILLADFVTGSSQLRGEHRRWLVENAVAALSADRPGWVFIRGFASRLGGEASNMQLSRARAGAVYDFLVSIDRTESNHISAVEAVGESWGPPVSQNNDANWRAVEVIITPARQPLPIREPTRTIQRQPRMIERRLQCTKIDTHPTNRLPADHEGEGEAISELVHNMMDLHNPERSITCTTGLVPDNYRVNRITIRERTINTGVIVANNYDVIYDWGVPIPQAVLIDERGGQRQTRNISRRTVQSIYRRPGQFFR